ncbi:MAG: hypothetical protein WC517_00555 [Patescibacteria group bacterium]
MLEKCEIVCKVGAGYIQDAIKEAIRMAKKERTHVTFEFNNVTITVQKDSHQPTVLAAFGATGNKEGSRIGPTFAQQEKKFTHKSVMKCRDTFVLLTRLEEFGGLPEGISINSPILQDSDGIMNYAERVLSNEQFWDSLPKKRKGFSKQELREELKRLIDESK